MKTKNLRTFCEPDTICWYCVIKVPAEFSGQTINPCLSSKHEFLRLCRSGDTTQHDLSHLDANQLGDARTQTPKFGESRANHNGYLKNVCVSSECTRPSSFMMWIQSWANNQLNPSLCSFSVRLCVFVCKRRWHYQLSLRLFFGTHHRNSTIHWHFRVWYEPTREMMCVQT